MNIYAIKGHKVIFANPDSGYDSDQKHAAKYLEVGKMYTVDCTYVDDSHTDVCLVEFPNVEFNSVHFDDVEPQCTKDSSKHDDWLKYNEPLEPIVKPPMFQKLHEIDPDKRLYRGVIIKIRKWFKCPTGWYDYDFMLIDGDRFKDETTFDVICINYSAGARNILSPLKTNVPGSQAITAEELFKRTHSMLNALRGRRESFTIDEVKDHIFIYNIEDIKEINPGVTPFTGEETYNS